MKEGATIFDYVRMCKYFDDDCQECPVFYKQTETGLSCEDFIRNCPDKANEIILKWCEEHPVETRQDKLLKCYPYIPIIGETVDICPKSFDRKAIVKGGCDKNVGCVECKKEYWLAEVQE